MAGIVLDPERQEDGGNLMPLLIARPALRWVVPVAVVAVVLTAGVAGRALTADAGPSLPPRTASQLLVDLQTSAVTGLSGTVVQRADLGLPEPPVSVGGRGSSEFAALVTGTHTLRVWYAGEQRQRIALLGSLGESDLVRNGRDVWTWSSSTNAATHLRLPAAADREPRVPADLPTTPQQAADAALAAIGPSTSVSTDGTATVAGRAAYELVLRPKNGDSLIGQVRIAIDAEQQVPLRVRVYARGVSDPAVEIGFSQISFVTPGPEHFAFQPPPDATVTEASPGDVGSEAPQPGTATRTVGDGWTTVLVTDAPDLTGSSDQPSGLDSILGSLPRTSGSWGSGRLLTSALVSVLVTDDGRLLVGAVRPERLFQVAAG